MLLAEIIKARGIEDVMQRFIKDGNIGPDDIPVLDSDDVPLRIRKAWFYARERDPPKHVPDVEKYLDGRCFTSAMRAAMREEDFDYEIAHGICRAFDVDDVDGAICDACGQLYGDWTARHLQIDYAKALRMRLTRAFPEYTKGDVENDDMEGAAMRIYDDPKDEPVVTEALLKYAAAEYTEDLKFRIYRMCRVLTDAGHKVKIPISSQVELQRLMIS